MIRILAVIGAMALGLYLLYVAAHLGWILEIESWVTSLYIRLHTYIYDPAAWERWKVSSDPVKKFWWERN
jgi:hypothetical protein